MPWSLQYRRKWRDLSLQTKCLMLISVPAAATVVMFGVANMLTVRNATAGDQTDRAFHAAREIQRLSSADAAMSASARAYFITGQESFVAQARQGIEAFTSSEHRLLNLTAGAPLQQQCLAQIASIENAREEHMFGGMARFRLGALPPDQLRVALGEVETERSRMARLLQALDQDNTRQLEASLSHVQALRAEQGVVTGLCLFLGLLGGVAMSLLFARGITGRVASLQHNVAKLVVGGAPDALPGRDEIGTLNLGLLEVAELVRRRGIALENALHGIAEIDSAGRCVWRNKTYAEMTGYSGMFNPPPIAELAQPEDRPRLEQAIAEMRRNGRAEIAARLNQFSSRTPDVGITFLSTDDRDGANADSSFYVFLRDIWAGKRADAALVRAKEAAEASNQAKTEFLARISHDIRTPLNAILGSADLLSQTPLNFDQSEYVSMFQRNCRRLVSLINDFLDFARIEAGAVRVERVPFRVRETVLDAMATFRESASRKGITLGVEIDPAAPLWVVGDPLRLQQILVNLLSNALKFTEAGRVDANVKVLREASAGDQLHFEVSDSGPGIRLEDQDKIFARFVQLPNPSNGQRGTGLGLTICRDLVELMGGEIGLVSREGSGSTFYFNLPLEAVDPVAACSDTRQTVPTKLALSAPVRILLAEDTEDSRLLLEHFLRDEPVKLRTVANGLEALNAVQQEEQFDLILMDIDMPQMDGYTATRHILSFQLAQGQASRGGLPAVSQESQTTPIVALSADAMQEAVHASLEAGCVAHVAKPIDRETLLRTIRRFARAKPAPAPDARALRTRPVSEQVMALVPQYLAAKAKQIEEARAALASRDFGPIRRFGHNLKGTGRGYGFPPIEEMGREIERAAVEADAGRIASQLDALYQFVTESTAPVNS